MLAFLAHPDAAILLLLLGILLLYAEFNRPGTVLLGSLGMLFAMLALHDLALHPIAHGPIAIAILGLALIVLELRLPTHSFLAIAGTLILACALVTLLPTPPRIDAPTALATSALFSVTTLWLGRIALQARRNKRVPQPHRPSPAR